MTRRRPMLCRLMVFAYVPGKVRPRHRPRAGHPPVLVQGAWQDWHAGAKDERRDARLRGAGSFYWPSPRAAWRRACVLMNANPLVSQVLVEGIGAQPVGRLVRCSGGSYGYATCKER